MQQDLDSYALSSAIRCLELGIQNVRMRFRPGFRGTPMPRGMPRPPSICEVSIAVSPVFQNLVIPLEVCVHLAIETEAFGCHSRRPSRKTLPEEIIG